MVRATLIIILSTAWHTLAAQPMQAMLWKVHTHCFDFRTDPPKVNRIYDESHTYEEFGNWYVGDNGDVLLDSREEQLLTKDGNKVEGIEESIKLFVPAPGNSNILYCIGEYSIFRLDLEHYVVTDIIETTIDNFVVVHSRDCSKLWLISFDGLKPGNTKYIVYAITQDNIIQHKEIGLTPDVLEKTYFPKNYPKTYLNLHLSTDCNLYTLCNTKSNKVFYGAFDRTDITFKRKSSYCFEKYHYVENTIISPDKSRIYYVLRKDIVHDFVEVKIENGIPNYETARIFHTEDATSNEQLEYGPDGKVYAMNYELGLFAQIEIVGGISQYRHFAHYQCFWGRTHYPIASWFLDNPCGPGSSNPCPEMESPVIRWGSGIKK